MDLNDKVNKVLGKVFLDSVYEKAKDRYMKDMTGIPFDETFFRVIVESVVDALEPPSLEDAAFFYADFEPRYWEDAKINGIEDTYGELMPLKENQSVRMTIDLESGRVLNWPEGTTAKLYYKVCDQGEYFLLNDIQETIAKYKSDYVPDSFLCFGDEGFGDYIIMNINEEGFIESYTKPQIRKDLWKILT